MILPGTGRGTATGGRGGGGASLRKPEVYLARKLRRQMSLPEAMLWQRLRSNQIGVKVRRQHPIGPYVADLYVRECRLVIEVDGEAHNRGERPLHDNIRDKFLAEAGYRMLRIPASAILNDVEAIVEGIAAWVASPLHHPADGPPPHAGEEL